MKMQMRVLWAALMCSMLILMSGCTELTNHVQTFYPNGAVQTDVLNLEKGPFLGDAHFDVSGPGVMVLSDRAKGNTDKLLLGVAGLAAGAYLGGPAGAAIGGAGGYGLGTLTGDKPTSGTAALLAPIMSSNASRGLGMGTQPGAAGPQGDAAAALLGLGSGTGISPEIVALLRDYVSKHPGTCRLYDASPALFDAVAAQLLGVK